MTKTLRNLRINISRLEQRLEALAQIGAIDGGGVCRLALTQEDKAGRDLVVSWMKELGLTITIDQLGNVVGERKGREAGPPVMTGSHIDTVRTGGRYDGNYGVLAGLEVLTTLEEAKVSTKHPIAVAFFTNEEGARFAPDMMGSLVHQGVMPLQQALETVGIDGSTVAKNLQDIGYDGDTAVASKRARAFVELHIEQGPVLEQENICIGAVESVQGISWTEVTITGTSNHAGTTPMSLRHDAGYAAAEIACFVRKLALDLGHPQVSTVGSLVLSPNLVNVVANKAVMTVDLRNTDNEVLLEAERRTFAFLDQLAKDEGVTITRRSLARFDPVLFDSEMVSKIEAKAKELGHSVRRMPSGAGHDAQIFAPYCPTAMIFVPSVGGISHNVKEFTESKDLEAGANILLQVLSELAE